MRRPDVMTILRFLLAAFFVFGGIVNIIAPGTIQDDYLRWGYPDWFHYLTGALELTAAALLISRYRLFGAILGACVMTGAVSTVIYNGEYSHAIAPFITLCVSLLVAASNRTARFV